MTLDHQPGTIAPTQRAPAGQSALAIARALSGIRAGDSIERMRSGDIGSETLSDIGLFCTSAGSAGQRWWVVDGGAVDGARALGRVGDHPAVGQPLQVPAATQPAVMPGAEQAHALDLG